MAIKQAHVLLPTGAKVPMESFMTKKGTPSKGVALVSEYVDGSGTYFRKGGRDIIAPAKHVPSTVQVLGETIEVAQRVGAFVPNGRTLRGGAPAADWVDDPNGEPETNSNGNPVQRGSKVLTHKGQDYRFELRITVVDEDLWNVSASLFEKSKPLTQEQKKANRKARALAL